MREVLPELMAVWEAGGIAGVATVVATFRSAPRPAGASMLVDADGNVTGSISGGCVEGAVYDLAATAIATGVPVLERYGIDDEDALAVGLTCGGTIEVFVEPVSRATLPELGEIAGDIAAHRAVAVATLIEHPERCPVGRRVVVRSASVTGSIGPPLVDEVIAEDARRLLAAAQNGVLSYGLDGRRPGDDIRVFVASYAPQPRMLVFGATSFAAALARQASFIGYRVTVCDARPVFATRARFPDAHEVVVDWPHRYLAAEVAAGALDDRSVICVLTHDPKFDVPLLKVALRQPVAYVGAMGSRRTHEDRFARLRRAGLSDTELGRLTSPLGLDLGARTPEETAVSIVAEILARQRLGTGRSLSMSEGPIHRC
ncbi:XdhC family protein [Nocardia rhamnosiphila]